MSSDRQESTRKRRVSSHDVARKAGVSQSAVSLILSGRENTRISEQTRQRVLEVAAQLNYSPNAAARALVTGRTHRIGVVTNHPNSFSHRGMYYGTVLTGVMAGAVEYDYNLLLHSAHHPNWQSFRDEILSEAADGILLVGRYPQEELTISLIEARFPAVCVSFQPDHPFYYSVDCDNVAAGCLAAQHLISLGHRHIAFIYYEDNSFTVDRRAGALKAMEEAGLAGNLLLTTVEGSHPWDYTTFTRQVLEQVLAASPRPTAAIFVQEDCARLFVEEIPQYQLRVPEDIAVISFDSTEVSERSRVALSSIYQPLEEIGKAGVEMLTDLIEGRPVESGVKRFPVRLDVRDSCGAHTAPRG